MLRDEIRKILSSRIALDNNDDMGIEKHWNQEINLFKSDIRQTVQFFDDDCTADEFDWFSEIFESLAESTQSKTVVETLFRFILNHPECIVMPGVYEHCLYAEGAIVDEHWECPLKKKTEELFFTLSNTHKEET